MVKEAGASHCIIAHPSGGSTTRKPTNRRTGRSGRPWLRTSRPSSAWGNPVAARSRQDLRRGRDAPRGPQGHPGGGSAEGHRRVRAGVGHRHRQDGHPGNRRRKSTPSLRGRLKGLWGAADSRPDPVRGLRQARQHRHADGERGHRRRARGRAPASPPIRSPGS